MLFIRFNRIIFMIILEFLIFFSISHKLKKITQLENSLNIDNDLLKKTDLFSTEDSLIDNNYKLRYQILKYNLEKELSQFRNISDISSFLNNEKKKSNQDNIQDNNFNRNSDYQKDLNLSPTKKNDKNMFIDGHFENEINSNNNLNFNKIQSLDNNNINNHQHLEKIKNKTKYDYVYYPKEGDPILNSNFKRSGVFAYKNYGNEQNNTNIEDFKIPNENKWIRLEPVRIVKEVSPETRAAWEIENIQDQEYKKILKNGYQDPNFQRNIVQNYPTRVEKPSNVNSEWKPAITLDPGMWENVQYNSFDQRTIEPIKFNIPASFDASHDSSMIVNTPSITSTDPSNSQSNDFNNDENLSDKLF